jgi:hypothetical protein
MDLRALYAAIDTTAILHCGKYKTEYVNESTMITNSISKCDVQADGNKIGTASTDTVNKNKNR